MTACRQLQAVEDTLDVIYGAAPGSLQAATDHIFQAYKERIKAMITLADKYNMPKLIRELDSFLISQHQQGKLWKDDEEASTWAAVIGSKQLTALTKACGEYLAKSPARNAARLSQILPIDVSLSLTIALLGQLQERATS